MQPARVLVYYTSVGALRRQTSTRAGDEKISQKIKPPRRGEGLR